MSLTIYILILLVTEKVMNKRSQSSPPGPKKPPPAAVAVTPSPVSFVDRGHGLCVLEERRAQPLADEVAVLAADQAVAEAAADAGVGAERSST